MFQVILAVIVAYVKWQIIHESTRACSQKLHVFLQISFMSALRLSQKPATFQVLQYGPSLSVVSWQGTLRKKQYSF